MDCISVNLIKQSTVLRKKLRRNGQDGSSCKIWSST